MPPTVPRSFKSKSLTLSAFFLVIGLAALGSNSLDLLQPTARAATATVFSVNSTGDQGDSNLGDGVCNNGAGVCTLRAAIQQANPAGGDTINFALPIGSKIVLAGTELLVDKGVSINGPAADALTVSGNNLSRVFRVTSATSVFISGLTVSEGRAVGGGGIFNDGGTLTINNCYISNNNGTTGVGGGITNGGPSQNGQLNVNNSTISNNTANGGGGGLYQIAFATLNQTTISNNTTSANGGGIHNGNPMSLNSVTITGNTAAVGGGIYNPGIGALALGNTVVAGNIAPSGPDCSGVLISMDYNLIGNTTGVSFSNVITHNLTNVSALLGPLAANGGPTPTHALLVGSPAIDKGNSTGFITDQRGQPRVVDNLAVANAAGGNASDIGAFEAHNLEVNSIADTTDGVCGAVGTGNGCTLREAVAVSNAESGSELISFAPSLTFGGPAVISLLTALPDLSSDLKLTGSGATLLTVQRSPAGGTPNFSVFHHTVGTTTISGLKISNGKLIGILNSGGTLTINSCIVDGNDEIGVENGQETSASLIINDCMITNHTVAGVWNRGLLGAIVTAIINNSTISLSGENGIFNAADVGGVATLTVNGSTISGNNTTGNGSTGGIDTQAQAGGAASATINNSTIFGNNSTDFYAGGVSCLSSGTNSNATVTLNNSTVTQNNAPASGSGAGGVSSRSVSSGFSKLTLNNTIVAGNHVGGASTFADALGPIDATSSFNLIGDGTGMSGISNGVNGNQVGTLVSPINPLLSAVAGNYGGTTLTFALNPGSPALDAGSNALISSPTFSGPPFTDQRGSGFARIVDGPDADTVDTVDIGAFESQVSVPNLVDQTINEDSSLSLPFNVDAAASLTSVTATSSNTALVPNNVANISVSGSGSSRTLQINPVADGAGPSTITVTANGTNGQTMTDTFLLTVLPIADLPSVTNAATYINTQTSSGLVISRNPVDGPDVDSIKITNIQNGTLFKNNGTTQIANDSFITTGEGTAGLKFTPATGLTSPGTTFSFQAQTATNSTGAGISSPVTATITVTCASDPVVINTNDSGAGSLREAILGACPGATVTFNIPTSDPNYIGGTYRIALTSGELLIKKNLTIIGIHPFNLQVSRSASAASNFRIFNVESGNTVFISGMTISGGFGNGSDGGAIFNGGTLTLDNFSIFSSHPGGGLGGGIFNNAGATLTLTNGQIVGNEAHGGGGIWNNGTLTIRKITFNANIAYAGNGGGINNNGILTMSDTYFMDNLAQTPGRGAGILNGVNGVVTMINSSFTGNSAGGGNFGGSTSSGGGIHNSGTITLINTTLSTNNSLKAAGGIHNVGGSLTLINTTVTNNRSDFNTDGGERGGGILREGGTVTLKNTIVAGNFRGKFGSTRDDINGAVDAASSFNLIADGTDMTGISNGTNGNQVGSAVTPINPLLQSVVATNPNQTPSYLLLPGSPAINAGSNALVPTDSFDLDGDSDTAELVPLDQRGVGYPRNIYGTVDVGSVEVNYSLTASAGTPQSTAIGTAFSTQLRATVLESGNIPNFNINVTFAAPTTGPSGTFPGNLTTTTAGLNGAGVSIAPVFTANSIIGGPYNVVASIGPTLPTTTFSLTNTQSATSTAVTSSANPSDFGQNVTFTATVTASDGTPSGTVQFRDGPDVIGGPVSCVAGAGNTCAAQFSTAALGVGTHTISATFSPDSNHLGSVGTLTGGQIVKSPPTISINDVSVTETNSGTTSANFSVTLSAASSLIVTVNFATANSSATAGVDYQSSTGTVTFLPNETSKPISVAVNGDVSFESDETFFVNLSAPVNATISDNQGHATILNDDAQGGFISFSQADYSVGESGGLVTITVNRSNDLTNAASVDYATSDDSGAAVVVPCATVNGRASSRCDFTTALGTLRFAAGENSKTFTVLISQDNFVEGPETLSLALSNATGGAVLIAPSAATLTISDDAVEPGPNPVDDADVFVRQHYHDFLNREPDAAGLAFWSNQITECQQPGATCSAEVRRINVSGAFFLSIEFQETGYLVERIYKSAYGDAQGTSNFGPTHQLPVPIVRFLEFLPDTQQISRGVIVGAPGAEQLLEANKVAFTQDFVTRPRFITAYASSLTPTQFVDALYVKAGVTPSASDRATAINEFGGAGNTADIPARARALRRVAENSILNQQEKNRAFVLMQYFGYLRRNPNDPQDSDYTGYDFWLTKLNEFNGNFVSAEMVKAFIVSGEYRHRFGQ